ncbi:MAG: DNA polymerase III subunit gamma/tau [Oscillospiraceae bacterium]|nr:DNA polymerase III subunit gamma/tau [Oscillospiraceae bacterium]
MYQALYRKWRPRTFSDVVGQPHITQTLARQVETGRISHAYLFTGTRGTGKTTVAKILARAVNCEHPVHGDPCNECAACRGIENGSILDVVEMDAASNRSIDDVRALRDEAIFSPASVRRRVYIVDEVHMLTREAFNALLKIMEEPPEHLLFILATTEVHKVPATVLSRCQQFAFRRIRTEDIAARLGYVAEQEQIDLTADGARLLAQLSDGALRDGLSLLDQCRGGGGTVDTARVLESTGLAGSLDTLRLYRAVAEQDGRSVLRVLDELYLAGKEMGAVLSELSALLRDLLVLETAPEEETLLSGRFDPAELKKISLSPARLLTALDVLREAAGRMSLSANRRLDAEAALLRLCDPAVNGDTAALTARIERLEALLADGGTPRHSPEPVRREPEPPRHVETVPEPERPVPKAASAPPSPEPVVQSVSPEPAVQPVPTEPAAPAEDGEALRGAMLPLLQAKHIPSALRALSDREQVEWRLAGDGVLLLTADDDTQRQLNRAGVRTALTAAVEEHFGAPLPVTIRQRTDRDGRQTAPEAEKEEKEDKFDGLLALGEKFDLSTK